MIDPVRIQILTSVGLLATAITLRAQEQPALKAAFAIWSEDSKVPALCVGRPEWFVSLAPGDVEIKEGDSTHLKMGSEKAEGKIIFVDEPRRLCVIEVSQDGLKATPLPLSPDPFPKAGLQLHCFYSQESCHSVVAGKDFFFEGEALPIPYLRVRLDNAELSCRIGAPLFSQTGELVGLISTRVLQLDREAHAIPAAQIRKVILDLERFSRTARSTVGLVFHDQSTPVVLEVKEDSPASKAGFEPGDVIISLNGAEIEELLDLYDAPFNLPAGVPVRVVVLRGIEEVEMEVTPVFQQASADR